MKVDDAFYLMHCARCCDNARPDGKHVMCLRVNCRKLDAYSAQLQKALRGGDDEKAEEGKQKAGTGKDAGTAKHAELAKPALQL